MDPTEIFLSAPPGLETSLEAEARAAGFADPVAVSGGVTITGGWPEVWRANLCLRGAARVLARIGGFRAFHLAQLDKRARKFPWGEAILPGTLVRVDVTCRKSKIYHDRAAKARIEGALEDVAGAVIQRGTADEDEDSDGEALRLVVRIEDDLVTFSLDTSGAPLHRRGTKQAVGKAPMRETLAAHFLRACGYDGQVSVVDPMCGSGTFVLEAAEIACGLLPGRSRDFAFERMAGFDAEVWAEMRGAQPGKPTGLRFYGSDRDDGAIRGAQANAERAGQSECCIFARHAISDLQRPEGPPGLVMVNPPYGARIGNRKLLFALYGTLGSVLKDRFGGWRLGLVTSDAGLAKATGLAFQPKPMAVSHSGLTVRLYQTGPL
jgi:putative N6-adenine-specific DNA methylase